MSKSLQNTVTQFQVASEQPGLNLNGMQKIDDSQHAFKSEERRMKANEIAMKLKRISEKAATEVSADSTIDRRFFVGRLSSWTDEEMLREYFSQFGTLADVFMPRQGSSHRGFAFITYSELFEKTPFKMTGHVIDKK